MYRVSSLRICVVRRSYRHSHHQLALKRMSSSSQTDDGVPYDMVIAGGGMVGTALACCIGRGGERERESMCEFIIVIIQARSQHWLLEGFLYLNLLSLFLLVRLLMSHTAIECVPYPRGQQNC